MGKLHKILSKNQGALVYFKHYEDLYNLGLINWAQISELALQQHVLFMEIIMKPICA